MNKKYLLNLREDLKESLQHICIKRKIPLSRLFQELGESYIKEYTNKEKIYLEQKKNDWRNLTQEDKKKDWDWRVSQVAQGKLDNYVLESNIYRD